MSFFFCDMLTDKSIFQNKVVKGEGMEDDPYAITNIAMSPDCKQLLVAGQSAQVTHSRLDLDVDLMVRFCVFFRTTHIEHSRLGLEGGGGGSRR